MNTNPNATKILCYGDSNTWGQKPDKTGRYPADVRWTGQLQNLLGDEYYIIEEGLGSRTTDLEYAKKPGRNGKTYLSPCLESHSPLDLVILMLGTNDLKIEFERSAQDIAQAIGDLIQLIKERAVTADGKPPRVLLVSPILIDDTAPNFEKFYAGVYYDHESAAKSTQLAAEIEAIAGSTGCSFTDAASVSQAGDDGIHFSIEAHANLAKLLHEKIVALNLRKE